MVPFPSGTLEHIGRERHQSGSDIHVLLSLSLDWMQYEQLYQASLALTCLPCWTYSLDKISLSLLSYFWRMFFITAAGKETKTGTKKQISCVEKFQIIYVDTLSMQNDFLSYSMEIKKKKTLHVQKSH